MRQYVNTRKTAARRIAVGPGGLLAGSLVASPKGMAQSEIDYGGLLQRALRSVVRQVLERTVREGLPGEHHFYLSFRTDHAGTELPPFLRQRFPEEITVVLQHQFRDLVVDDGGFAVTLRFDGMPARLVVPWDAVVAFFDPTAEFGLRFDMPALAGGATPPAGLTAVPPLAADAGPQPETTGKPAVREPGDEKPAAAGPAAAPAEPSEEPAAGKVLSFGRPRERRDPE